MVSDPQGNDAEPLTRPGTTSPRRQASSTASDWNRRGRKSRPRDCRFDSTRRQSFRRPERIPPDDQLKWRWSLAAGDRPPCLDPQAPEAIRLSPCAERSMRADSLLRCRPPTGFGARIRGVGASRPSSAGESLECPSGHWLRRVSLAPPAARLVTSGSHSLHG